MFDHKFRYLDIKRRERLGSKGVRESGTHHGRSARDVGTHKPKIDLALPEDDQVNDPHEDSAFDAIKKNEDDESTVEMLLSWNSTSPNRGGKMDWCKGKDEVTFQEKVHLENVWRDQDSALRKHHNYEEEDFDYN